MNISATMVRDLREKTGAGMMDCKTALKETGGNFEEAADWLRKKGISKAEKKAGRVAAEGMVCAASDGTQGAILEVNAETDFVAKNEQFQSFVQDLTTQVLANSVADIEAIKAMPWKGGTNGASTVAEKLRDLIATIGENMTIRRAACLSADSGIVKSYVHMGGKIGVLVAIEAPDSTPALEETARNIAMHVAAANPQFLDRSSVDTTALDKEREIFSEQARQSGKPENIVEKIVEGRINKYYEEVCLVDQAFVMDTDRKVGQVLQDAAPDARIKAFTRYALGEGIEKDTGDFAAEVAAAVNG